MGGLINEDPLRAEDWREIFSTVPMYPLNLPDNLVREIAQLAINVRRLAEEADKGVANKDTLTTWMGPSLVSSSLKKIRELILDLEQKLKARETGVVPW